MTGRSAPASALVKALVAATAALLLGSTPEPAPKPVTAAGLLDDGAVLYREYTALHPGLLRYNSPASIEASYAQLRASLAAGPSLGDAFLAFTRFTASIRCGHSYPNFYNQPSAIESALFRGENRVPFYFEWRDRRMIVTRNFSSDPRIVPGSEIRSIDGTPTRTILTTLLPLARADGSNDAKRIDELGVRGDDRYEAFDIYYPLLFPSRSPSMTLDVVAPSGSRFTASVKPLTYEQRIAPIAASLSAATDPKTPLWHLQMLDPHTGYLRMPTWETYHSSFDWKADVNRIFASLVHARASKLIVDLRGNEGGTDVGSAIIAHLIAAPLPLDTYARLTRYRRVPDDLRRYLITWDSSFFDWGARAVAVNHRFFQLPAGDDSGADAIAPAAPRFSGTVIVLVDATNSSATFQFAETVQRAHLATLVGTPTGGNQRGINGGAFFFIHLPHSQIEVDLPLIGTFPSTPQPDAGISPDIIIMQTPQSIARGRDLVLERAEHLSG